MELKYMVRLEKLRKVPRVHAIDGKIDFYALLILFSGKMEYIVNGESFSLQNGDALFIPPGTSRIRLASDTETEYFALNFFTEENIELPVYMRDVMTTMLKSTIKMFDKTYQDSSGIYREEKTQKLLELIIILLKEFSERQAKNPNVDAILKYIDAHFTENLTLSEIASHVNLTVPYCCSIVKKELGCTVYDLIMQKRVSLAQHYITDTDIPLDEISSLCGFYSYGSFSKTFKNFHKATPKQFKKEYI